MKYMLNQPLIIRRIGKWSLALSEFTLIYFPQKSVNGQALANFLPDHHSLEIKAEQRVKLGIYGAEKEPWILKFDGSSIENLGGAEILIISPRGVKTTLAFEYTNNQVELSRKRPINKLTTTRNQQIKNNQLINQFSNGNLL